MHSRDSSICTGLDRPFGGVLKLPPICHTELFCHQSSRADVDGMIAEEEGSRSSLDWFLILDITDGILNTNTTKSLD